MATVRVVTMIDPRVTAGSGRGVTARVVRMTARQVIVVRVRTVTGPVGIAIAVSRGVRTVIGRVATVTGGMGTVRVVTMIDPLVAVGSGLSVTARGARMTARGARMTARGGMATGRMGIGPAETGQLGIAIAVSSGVRTVIARAATVTGRTATVRVATTIDPRVAAGSALSVTARGARMTARGARMTARGARMTARGARVTDPTVTDPAGMMRPTVPPHVPAIARAS